MNLKKDSVLHLWPQFDRVVIEASLDGSGERDNDSNRDGDDQGDGAHFCDDDVRWKHMITKRRVSVREAWALFIFEPGFGTLNMSSWLLQFWTRNPNLRSKMPNIRARRGKLGTIKAYYFFY